MSSTTKTPPTLSEIKEQIIAKAPLHVVFDGFTRETFDASARDAGIDPELARDAFPKGILDVAVEIHLRGDADLAERLAREDLNNLRYSERVAHAVFLRLEIAGGDKELVRRAAAFFALPSNALQGSKCIWNTADTIWRALGDTSDDLNWYSKRVILSGVYSSSLLYWLGDDSEDRIATKTFVDRRIADVMRFEKTKAEVKSWRIYDAFRKGPGRIFDGIKAPGTAVPGDMPGHWRE